MDTTKGIDPEQLGERSAGWVEELKDRLKIQDPSVTWKLDDGLEEQYRERLAAVLALVPAGERHQVLKLAALVDQRVMTWLGTWGWQAWEAGYRAGWADAGGAPEPVEEAA